MQILEFIQNFNFYETLKSIYFQIGETLSAATESNSATTIISLILLSFLYGLLHAAGLRHGKTVVASYFSANDKSYAKAIAISLSIAIVHVFSAFGITAIGYFILSDLLQITVYNTNKIIVIVSALIIILIGLNILKNKIIHYKSLNNTKWQAKPFAVCACSSCNQKDSQDIWIVIASGIIPCPGTITIFLLAITSGLYFYAFVSAIAMSIGMSSVIAASATISIKIRQSFKSKYKKQIKYLDLAATSMIIILGAALLVSVAISA